MKTLRLALIAPVLALLVAVPAAAETRAVPSSDAALPSSTIEGTITSVSIPFVGGGPIVTLLDGLVHFDANGASVKFADGTAGTTADLAAGQRIVAFVDATASPLRATSIVIVVQRNDVALTGKVDAVDTAAKTLTVLGFVVKVTDKTVFGGPMDGAGQAGLADLNVGDLVLVAATADAGSLVANRVMKLAPSVETAVRLHGTVDSIGTDTWTITLKNGSKASLKISTETKFVGDPKVGDEVDVLAQKQSDGSYLALSIVKITVAPPIGAVSFDGVVKSITPAPSAGPAGSMVVATWVVDTTKVVVSRMTVVKGDPKVGDKVHVEGLKTADGSVAAALIAKIP